VHRLVATAALVTHVVFVAFTVVGGFLAWFLPWVLIPHVASALWGGRMLVWRKTCPLSVAENWGRQGAGLPPLNERGFLAHYFEERLYPSTSALRVEIVATGLVLGSWFGFAVR
jgi:hypothetical protein